MLNESASGIHGLFSATVDIPDAVGGHTLYAYAHSNVSGHDTWIAVPIEVVR